MSLAAIWFARARFVFPRHEAGQLTSIFAPVNPFNETQIRERCMKMVLIFVLLQYTFVNTVIMDSWTVVWLTDYCANATTSVCASDRHYDPRASFGDGWRGRDPDYYDSLTYAACTRSAESQEDSVYCFIPDPGGVCPLPDGSPCFGGRNFDSSAPERLSFLA